jgi:nitrous oxidase accessory protein NosD
LHRNVFLVFATVCLLLSCLNVFSVKSQTESANTIFISTDGAVTPASASIKRIGNVYTFTETVHAPIVIEQNHIILDGAGHYLEGNGGGIGINITASDVTIMNLHVMKWDTGVLGAYDGNNVIWNSISNCEFGIKVYGANYNIARNYIGTNYEGIGLRANGSVVSENRIVGNEQGIDISWCNHVITGNNMSNDAYDIAGSGRGGVVVYCNNFLRSNPNRYLLTLDNAALWDDGTVGNYWSGYSGADANGDGVGDTPYRIQPPYHENSEYAVDYHPLMKPYLLPEAQPPSPTLHLTPTPELTQTPQPSTTLSPTPDPTATSEPSSSPQQTTAEPDQSKSMPLPTELFIAAVAIVAAVAIAIFLAKRERQN